MRVLGIDPGLSMTGWGVVNKLKDKLSLIDYGCIKTPANTPLPERLKTIHIEVKAIIEQYTPDCIAIEELFFLKAAKSVAGVGQARGAILLTVLQKNIQIFEYNPRHIKIAITGYGSADKQQMQNMVKTLLALKETPKPDDAADAIGMAICHLNTNRVLSSS